MDWLLSRQKFPPFQPTGLLFMLFLFLPYSQAYWLSFLPRQPMGFITSPLGLPQPIYFTFTSYCAHGPVGCHSCHIGPLSLLPLFLGFLGPLALPLTLIGLIGLLAVIPVTLAHWVYYLFSQTSSAHLLYLYLLLRPQAYWLSFLPHWPIRFITSFLGLPQPIHFTSTSYCTHGPIGYHSCHIGPLGLLPLFLGFLVPFALPLPLITPMALLAIILVALAHWVYLSYFFYHLYFFFLSLSSLQGFFCHWAFLTKMGINNIYIYIFIYLF